MKLKGELVINRPDIIEPVTNSGEIKFMATFEDYACDIRIPIQTGHEKEAWAHLQNKLQRG